MNYWIISLPERVSPFAVAKDTTAPTTTAVVFPLFGQHKKRSETQPAAGARTKAAKSFSENDFGFEANARDSDAIDFSIDDGGRYVNVPDKLSASKRRGGSSSFYRRAANRSTNPDSPKPR